MRSDARQAALDRAKSGDSAALGELLDGYRPYVRVLVEVSRKGLSKARVADSDLIQDAFLLAHRHFGKFRGVAVAEFTCWLRQLTIRCVGHNARDQMLTEKRDADREVAIEDFDAFAANGSTPSSAAQRHEQAVIVATALEQLPDDMRQVLLARHLNDEPYADLAVRMGRTEGSLRILYTRGLRKLRQLLAEQDSSGAQ
jgi:RNA polymerase sigma-70 factor (ECF subfamily)